MDVHTDLQWCRGNWGRNEGAGEAVGLLGKYAEQVGGDIGALIAQAAAVLNGPLGSDAAAEILKRPPVMDAAVIVVKINEGDAVDLALTCQAHNPSVRQFLNERRHEVAEWLRTR